MNKTFVSLFVSLFVSSFVSFSLFPGTWSGGEENVRRGRLFVYRLFVCLFVCLLAFLLAFLMCAGFGLVGWLVFWLLLYWLVFSFRSFARLLVYVFASLFVFAVFGVL